MEDIVIYTLGLASIIIAVVALWYLFQTVRIMWGYNSLVAIAAVLFSPFVHIVFYFVPKDGFTNYEKTTFKRYFLSIGAIVILGVLAAIVAPSINEDSSANFVGEMDASEPWEWDIRSENIEAPINTDNDINAKAASLHHEAIYQSHPDADEVIESPEFAQWLQNKTDTERSNIDSVLKAGTAAEVIYFLSIFKKDLENYRASEYQSKRDNALTLAQRQYQEKQNRELENFKANSQRGAQQQQQYEQHLSTQTLPLAQTTTSTARQLSYDEKMERERIKDLISKPVNGTKGLTASQTEQLIALEQAPAPTTRRSYNEQLEHEKAKARISEPLKGSNGQLTRAQRDALVSLETGQPMPLR